MDYFKESNSFLEEFINAETQKRINFTLPNQIRANKFQFLFAKLEALEQNLHPSWSTLNNKSDTYEELWWQQSVSLKISLKHSLSKKHLIWNWLRLFSL
ncbi:hypothetical protein O181_123927 [Austropuccinia psidii MF-1]|uniref:Uncharacterized protein n=1 Tax=Austropuccinia psidii MF-1 TaxID=1389203 RepID=A0A9Q3Q5Y0_9BASI|nr:hypothetical protein [Austropuccinia psidii MF-1]